MIESNFHPLNGIRSVQGTGDFGAFQTREQRYGLKDSKQV
jgi:hypothetical protein